MRLLQNPDTAMASFVLVYRDVWPLLQRLSQLLAVDLASGRDRPWVTYPEPTKQRPGQRFCCQSFVAHNPCRQLATKSMLAQISTKSILAE